MTEQHIINPDRPQDYCFRDMPEYEIICIDIENDKLIVMYKDPDDQRTLCNIVVIDKKGNAENEHSYPVDVILKSSVQ